MRRCSLAGPFRAQLLGSGLWHLTAAQPHPVQIYLRTAEPGASEVLKDTSLEQVDLEWQDDGVAVTTTRAKRIATLHASSAIVHEFRDGLYDSLPLAGFDSDAQRFWKRVFRLMRIPGGRLLLGLVARRNR